MVQPHGRFIAWPDITSFFFDDAAATEIYTLSLHDALPICLDEQAHRHKLRILASSASLPLDDARGETSEREALDRKSTRLNSSHLGISYAVFCLKKKKPSDPHDLKLHHSDADAHAHTAGHT